MCHSDITMVLGVFAVESVATLFRGTSLATTLMDQYMKMTTSLFVHTAVQSTIDKIMESKQSCEVRQSIATHAVLPLYLLQILAKG